METEKFQKELRETAENIKSIVDLKLELFTLIAVEKISKAFTNFLALLISAIFAIIFLTLLSLVFVSWYKTNIGSEAEGYFIAAGFFVILAVIVYLLKNVLFLNPMIRGFAEAAFEKEENFLNSEKSGKESHEKN
jgi:uncharacterized membrane protein